ncbi:MAG: hypothetical protein ACTS1Z_05005 [Parasphingopyxis sp.]|uniref:hypothetical protein n=1 Tax=Parasphingopyxis sp. TaxID=1920299 RepID=UPI003FA013AB
MAESEETVEQSQLLRSISDGVRESSERYFEHAEQFANLAPVRRVSYFGFFLVTAAFGTSFASAALPYFTFSEAISIAALIAGVIVILIGVAGEAAIGIALGRAAMNQAQSLREEADRIDNEGRGFFKSLISRSDVSAE